MINQNNPQQFWQTLNELAGREKKKEAFPVKKFIPPGHNIFDDLYKAICDDFNSFF